MSVLEWALFELRLRGRMQQLLLLTGVLVRLHRLGQVAEVAEDAQMEQLVGLDSTYEKKIHNDGKTQFKLPGRGFLLRKISEARIQ